MSQTRRVPFTVLMLSTEKDQLEALCTKYGLSQNAILRRALTAFFQHDIDRIPTCANGNPCLAPHMYAHVQRPPANPDTRQMPFPTAMPALRAPQLGPLPQVDQEG